MPSPFPGMNPYLEQPDVWEDFHATLLPVLRDLLTPMVGPDLIVKLESQPYTGDAERHLFLEIRNRLSQRTITVLEVLSPSNKTRGADREQYLGKRRTLLSTPVNFVEIDLLRGGPRLPLASEIAGSTYYALASSYAERPRVAFWPISLRDPLPQIPIPLSLDNASNFAWLDLQQALHRVYDSADYGKYIYSREPKPPWNPRTPRGLRRSSDNTLKDSRRIPDFPRSS